jgi:hypothetical protein
MAYKDSFKGKKEIQFVQVNISQLINNNNSTYEVLSAKIWNLPLPFMKYYLTIRELSLIRAPTDNLIKF